MVFSVVYIYAQTLVFLIFKNTKVCVKDIIQINFTEKAGNPVMSAPVINK